DKRILKDADLLIGIFWTRLGTPTASYASGAVEEIEEHLKSHKPAMLYFSSAPAPLDSVDPAQYQALRAFKDWCTSRGLYASYADVDDFRRQLSKDLQIVMNADGVGTLDAMAPPKTTSGVAGALSADALLLLSAASADGSGTVLFERFGGGAEI